MEYPQMGWLVTFGMIGFWLVVPLIDLLRTPKTTPSINRNDRSDGNDYVDRNAHTNRTDRNSAIRTPAQGAYQ